MVLVSHIVFVQCITCTLSCVFSIPPDQRVYRFELSKWGLRTSIRANYFTLKLFDLFKQLVQVVMSEHSFYQYLPLIALDQDRICAH